MFNIYKLIADRLQEKLPTLRTIDADKGQLANPEQAYPIDFPAVLIDIDTVDWAEFGKKMQKGKGLVGITVAVQPTAQSHEGAPNIGTYVTEMEVVNDVWRALTGYLGLCRVKTTRQKRLDTIQVFTHTFTISLQDHSAMPTYTNNPAPPELKMYTNKSIANFPEDLE